VRFWGFARAARAGLQIQAEERRNAGIFVSELVDGHAERRTPA
jgi:hypothetical protein